MGIFNMDSPFMQTLGKLTDLVLLNLLAVLCSLPIVTLGASTAALYYSVNNLMEEKGNLYRGFFQAFKSNFKQATLLWLILLALGVILLMALWFYLQVEISFAAVLLVLVAALLFVWCLVISWTFPLQAKFENTVRGTLRNALLCAVAYLPRSFVMALLNIAPLLVFLFATEWFLRLGLLWFFIWYSLAALLILKLLKKPYASLIGKTQEAVEDKAE